MKSRLCYETHTNCNGPDCEIHDTRIAIVCTHNAPAPRRVMLPVNGRVVIERAMCNGATDIAMADGRPMSESEWEDYCAQLRAIRAENAGHKSRRAPDSMQTV